MIVHEKKSRQVRRNYYIATCVFESIDYYLALIRKMMYV